MNQSESQFQELMAHLIARSEKALATSNQIPPLSLALTVDGSVEVCVAVVDNESDLGDMLNTMQKSLSDRAVNMEIVATCMAFANYRDGHIEAMLENNENYCALVKIPVLAENGLKLDVDNLMIDDGHVYVFPIAENL